MDLAKELKLDKNHLDEECAHFIEVFAYYEEEANNASIELDNAKGRYDNVKDNRTKHYYLHPVEDMKNTDKQVAAMVGDDSDVLKAEQEYLQAKKTADTCKSIMRRLKVKDDEIDNTITLHNSNYYNTTKNFGTDRLNK